MYAGTVVDTACRIGTGGLVRAVESEGSVVRLVNPSPGMDGFLTTLSALPA